MGLIYGGEQIEAGIVILGYRFSINIDFNILPGVRRGVGVVVLCPVGFTVGWVGEPD